MNSTAETVQAQNQDIRKFELGDVCSLKSDTSLVGHVSRTSYDIETDAPLDHCLILSYVPVPEVTLTDFLSTGKPPKGYVFVTFVEPPQGSSLVHENDLELVDRPLFIGQAVKRHPRDTMNGIVTSVSTTCTLEPIVFRTLDPTTGEYGPIHFTENPVKWPDSPPFDNTLRPPLLHDVPLADVRNFEEFAEGDYIVYRQKVGVVKQVNRDVVLLLRNGAVVAPGTYEFEKPLSIESDQIVVLPGNQETLKSYPLENDKVLWSEECGAPYPGQFILSDSKSVRMGDWIHGSYSDSERPEGHAIATPALDVQVDWLCPNVFSVGTPFVSPDSEVIRASILRGEAAKCDFGRLPSDDYQGQCAIKSDSWLSIGDRVSLRDPAAVAVRYPQFQPIPVEESFGYDINIFRIVSSKTEVRVQWQDLSVTTEGATSVRLVTVPEDEVWPGDIVTLREGTEKISNPSRDRSEPLVVHSKAFQDDSMLVPRKTGVVQAVNSRERIASVCWYKDPKVELLYDGNVLRPSSKLGELSDDIQDVSMYELRMYSGLGKIRGDLVLIAPEKIHESLIPKESINPSTTAAGQCFLSYLSPITYFEVCIYLQRLKMVLAESDWFNSNVDIDSAPLPPRYSVHRDEFSVKAPADFVGRILDLDLNGTITVRLPAMANCRDVRIPLEKVLMVIDERVGPEVMAFQGHYPSYMSESFEDDGGQLTGDDSGDDLWSSEYDEIDVNNDGNEFNLKPDPAEIKLAEVSEFEHETCSPRPAAQTAHDNISSINNEIAILSIQQPIACPPSFAVLDSSPASDHAFLSKPVGSGIRVKRIRKEYQILESSLPPGIFARTWESRMDLLRVLIIGPQDTPYEYAPYVVDFHLGGRFPDTAPEAFFHSWTNGSGRINPNLYEDGRICLSILGTWPSLKPGEGWSPEKSTILQILVSISGLVLVKVPFYNEAGFEVFAAEGNSRVESTQYTEKAFVMTRQFINHALRHPVSGFDDVLSWHYLPEPGGKTKNKEHNMSKSDRPRLLRKAIEEASAMIERQETSVGASDYDPVSSFVSRLSLGAVVILQKHLTSLDQIEVAAAERHPQ